MGVRYIGCFLFGIGLYALGLFILPIYNRIQDVLVFNTPLLLLIYLLMISGIYISLLSLLGAILSLEEEDELSVRSVNAKGEQNE